MGRFADPRVSNLGMAGDDCHSIAREANRAWVVVAAPDLREDSIIAALRNGHFYSTEGPDLSKSLS